MMQQVMAPGRRGAGIGVWALAGLLAVGLVACRDEEVRKGAGATGLADVGPVDAGRVDVGQGGVDTGGADAGPTTPVGPVVVRFDPASEDFFDLPLPSDARRQADGSLGFRQWPGASQNRLLTLWFDAADELLQGWGLISGVFTYFSGPIDPASLPATLEASVSREGGWPSVALVDVTPGKASRGRIFPVECKFTQAPGTYHPGNQLACLSPMGLLREAGHTYAFVVTRGLLGADGEPVTGSAAMGQLLAGTDVGAARGADYQEAAAYLATLGLSAQEIVSLNLFTSGDPTARLRRVNSWYRELPEPEVDAVRGFQLERVYDTYVVLSAYYDVPVIQSGERPYDAPPQGKIVFGADGKPALQGTQSIRFYLTVPRKPQPAGGFPVMLYLHGSGGVAEELLDRGPKPDPETAAAPGSGPALTLARYGLAGFSADFNLHGMRHTPPDTNGLRLYNLLGNPRAAVDNFIIGANEVTLHVRLLRALAIDPAVAPEYLDAGLAPDGLIRFDAGRMAAMGHSMGSSIGLPALTVDQHLHTGILHGSGGVLIEVALTSDKPIRVSAALRPALGYPRSEQLDRFDPILHAVQQVWEFVDPVAHGPHAFLKPHEGVPPKHILQPSGLEDAYFSPTARAALSTSLGVELVEPVIEPFALGLMGWAGQSEPIALPASANRAGGVTGICAQYAPQVLDGHNVGFQRADAQAQYGCFLRSMAPGVAPIFRSIEASSPDACP